MERTAIRALATLAVAAFVAGSAYAPATAGSGSASAATARRAPLSASVFCDTSGICNAGAQGGTGEYVSWEWSGAEEWSDFGGAWSTASWSPYCVSGGMLGVVATVKDSSGATAYGYDWVFCP